MFATLLRLFLGVVLFRSRFTIRLQFCPCLPLARPVHVYCSKHFGPRFFLLLGSSRGVLFLACRFGRGLDAFSFSQDSLAAAPFPFFTFYCVLPLQLNRMPPVFFLGVGRMVNYVLTCWGPLFRSGPFPFFKRPSLSTFGLSCPDFATRSPPIAVSGPLVTVAGDSGVLSHKFFSGDNGR